MVTNNSQVQIWNNTQFGNVRTIQDENNTPYFCLADVCKALELHSKVVRQRLQDDVCSTYPILDSLGREQVATFVNEDGLYDVILDSRKPEARAFRKWVTSEVLPSIRKDGGYMVERPEETPEETMARALVIAQSTIERKNQRIAELQTENAQAHAQVEVLTNQNQEQAETIKKQAVKVSYVDQVLNAANAWTSTQIAPELGYRTAHALHIALAEKGVMKRANGMWVLTAKYTESGYAKTRTFTQTLEDGTTRTRLTTVWTEKGRSFLHSHFNKNIA